MQPNIGVFCYQGGGHLFIEALNKLGFQTLSLFASTDFSNVDGLILPGGESSSQYRFCREYGVFDKIRQYNHSKRPILAVCAGSILLSKHQDKNMQAMGLVDMKIERNSYGRQIESGKKFDDTGNEIEFIRAPKFIELNQNIKIKQTYQNSPILIQQENIFCSSYHPELGKINKENIIYKIFSKEQNLS